MKKIILMLILSIFLVSCLEEPLLITYEYQCYDGSFISNKDECPTIVYEENDLAEQEEKIVEKIVYKEVCTDKEEVYELEDFEIYSNLYGGYGQIYHLYSDEYNYGTNIKVHINLISNRPAQIKIFNTEKDYDIFMSAHQVDPKRTWQSVKELDVVEYVSQGNVLMIYNGHRTDEITVTGTVEYLN